MKTILIIAAVLVGYGLYQKNKQASTAVNPADPNVTPLNRPRRPWYVPPGVNVYAGVSFGQREDDYWASRTHPDATSPSVYSPPVGGVLVGPQPA